MYQVEQQTIREYVKEHKGWSLAAFGEGKHTEGLLRHIEKECIEVRKVPSDLFEWIDIVILAIDGAWREGYTPEQIASALMEKQNINKAREWPKMVADQPTEHIRE